ncbi:MAG: MarR family transcriptional regulator [Sporolactobacillus sp.]
MLIAENDGVIQRDLAEEMDVRPSSMTEMLTKMETLGLVERRQDERDQRVMHIFLTEQGKEAAKASQHATEDMTRALFAGLTDEELSKMLVLTDKLCAHLEAMDTAESNRNASQHGHHRGFGHSHDRGEFGRHWHHDHGFDHFWR